MKNWKMTVILIAGLGLSACLQQQDPSSFTLSYANTTERDVLTVSWDAKAKLNSLVGHGYFNGFKFDTLEGKKNFVESLEHGTRTHSVVNGQFILHPQGFDFDTSCTLSDAEIVSCNIEFPKNSFPLLKKNIVKLSIPFVNDSTEGLDDDHNDDSTYDIETPYLDLSNATGIADTDGDGKPDASDNCPTVANADQRDGDEDLIGDACDSAPNIPDEAFLRNEHGDDDYEGDGVINSVDNCVYTANEDQADLDNNGVGSICDETEPVVEGCRNLNKMAYNAAPGVTVDNCIGKDTSGASFGVFGPMSSSDGGFCALNPHSSTNFAPFAAIIVGLSCLLARRRYG